MTRRLRVLLVVLVVVALAWLAWWLAAGRYQVRELAPAAADTAQAGMRAATLWYADEGGDSLVSEVRELPEREGLHERVSQLVDALARGPEKRGVGVLPGGTAVLHAYEDDHGLLTLDLSRAFQQGFRGGSREEDLVVGSLLRTIASNLPDVRKVLIVCGGSPVASLGGHLPLDRPLDPHAVP